MPFLHCKSSTLFIHLTGINSVIGVMPRAWERRMDYSKRQFCSSWAC